MELQEAKRLALSLMQKHGLLEFGYTFEFGRMATTFGRCIVNQKRIVLSKILTELNDQYEVEQTILHEIAHALTPFHHHDKVWKATAKRIGYDGERCFDKTVITPSPRWLGICNECELVVKRNICKTAYCAGCYAKTGKLILIAWQYNKGGQ